MKISIEDKIYPDSLRKIENPPNQLYVKGNIDLLNTCGIAVIGSRNCTKYGENMAKKFSKELSKYNFTIISGMAVGIDSFAHISCIEAGKNTIAVLPSGLKNIYPQENIKLYEQILENNGLVVTEYEENQKADSNKFLERNRIVSGLAIGTLVIQGGYRSGTSVTAGLTKSQGKKVFCIPSRLNDSKGLTPNKLIKNGAKLVMCVEDIIEEYPEFELHSKNNSVFKVDNSCINEEYRNVYECLDEDIHIDEIAKKLEMDVNKVSYQLMMLELDDKVLSLPGGYFRKV